jgi:CheY-like chemotaxis protein
MSEERSVLIVEDEPLIAMMLEDFLDSLGHKVVASCDSVAEALEHVERGGFDVAIIDVQLKDGESVWPVADKLAEAGTPSPPAAMSSRRPPPMPRRRPSPSPTRSTPSSRRSRRPWPARP